MSAIVDYSYYSTVYMGTEADQASFPALCARAEDVVGAMTRWQVTEETFDRLPAFQRTLVKRAICAQTDFFAVNGLEAASGYDGRGFTVGKVSISGRSGGDMIRKGALADAISPLCLMYLEQSGLMNPNVPTLGEPMIGGWPGC